MKPVDRNLREAFAKFAESAGSVATAATVLGCTPKHVHAILGGRVQYLRPATWDRFRLHIAPHLVPPSARIDAPDDPKRRFVAERLHLLPDERIDQLVLELVGRASSD